MPSEEPQAEQVLVGLPTRGFGVAFGAPSLWTWTKWNLIKVTLTHSRLYGVWDPHLSRMLFSRKRGQVYFDIPVENIIEVKVARVGFNLAVAVKYQQADATKEVAIEGAVPWHGRIRELHEALQRTLAARGEARAERP